MLDKYCVIQSVHNHSYINSRIFTHYTIVTNFSYLLNPHHPFLFKYSTCVFCKSFTIFLKLIQQWQKPISQICNFLQKQVTFHIIIKILTTNCKFPIYQNTFNKMRNHKFYKDCIFSMLKFYNKEKKKKEKGFSKITGLWRCTESPVSFWTHLALGLLALPRPVPRRMFVLVGLLLLGAEWR